MKFTLAITENWKLHGNLQIDVQTISDYKVLIIVREQIINLTSYLSSLTSFFSFYLILSNRVKKKSLIKR